MIAVAGSTKRIATKRLCTGMNWRTAPMSQAELAIERERGKGVRLPRGCRAAGAAGGCDERAVRCQGYQ